MIIKGIILLSAVQTKDGILLGGGWDGKIYQLNYDGSVRKEVFYLQTEINDPNIHANIIEGMCLLSNNEIIIGSKKVIAFLNNN